MAVGSNTGVMAIASDAPVVPIGSTNAVIGVMAMRTVSDGIGGQRGGYYRDELRLWKPRPLGRLMRLRHLTCSSQLSSARSPVRAPMSQRTLMRRVPCIAAQACLDRPLTDAFLHPRTQAKVAPRWSNPAITPFGWGAPVKRSNWPGFLIHHEPSASVMR